MANALWKNVVTSGCTYYILEVAFTRAITVHCSLQIQVTRWYKVFLSKRLNYICIQHVKQFYIKTTKQKLADLYQLGTTTLARSSTAKSQIATNLISTLNSRFSRDKQTSRSIEVRHVSHLNDEIGNNPVDFRVLIVKYLLENKWKKYSKLIECWIGRDVAFKIWAKITEISWQTSASSCCYRLCKT